MASRDEPSERLAWVRRLRWRLRGAWQWPLLWTLTLADAVILRALPFSGVHGTELLGGFLIAGFLNLAVVVVAGPALGALLRRRRTDLPKIVATDRAASAALVALTVLLLVGGIANRDAVSDASYDAARQLRAARAWFHRHAPARFAGGIGAESVFEAGPDLYRTCIPGPDPAKNLCVYVNTAEAIPTVREDPDERPNSVVAGPDNPGRQ